MPYLMGGPFLTAQALVDSGVVGNLSGLNFRVPYIAITGATQATCLLLYQTSAIMGGETGASYDVDLHFQGVLERKTYTGGSDDGLYWQIGGTPAGDTFNTYKVFISSPAQAFYINKGTSGGTSCVAIDYTKTVQIDAGATVTFAVNSIDSSEILHASSSPASISISGVSDPSQPYPGQWANMTVTKVTKR